MTHFHRTLPSLAESDAPPKAVKVIYKSKSDFKAAVKVLGIMDDSKSGVPRMAYKGVVPTFYKGIRVYLSPGGGITSDAVASRLQISDLYKFDLQVASQFANWSKRAPEHVY